MIDRLIELKDKEKEIEKEISVCFDSFQNKNNYQSSDLLDLNDYSEKRIHLSIPFDFLDDKVIESSIQSILKNIRERKLVRKEIARIEKEKRLADFVKNQMKLSMGIQ